MSQRNDPLICQASSTGSSTPPSQTASGGLSALAHASALQYPSPTYSFVPQRHTTLKEVRCPPLCAIKFLFHLVYLCFLLGLPALYSSRVGKITKAATDFIAEIKQTQSLSLSSLSPADVVSGPHKNLKSVWDSFLDSLTIEWQMSNIVSVLLLSSVQFYKIWEFYLCGF